jgi:lipopolysaccharide transport system permease protein
VAAPLVIRNPALALHNLWRYRGFIASSVAREIRLRYLGSALGVVWLVLPPLLTIIIYTTVFGYLMNARLPQQEGPLGYAIYLCSGLVLWNFFAEVVQRSLNVFLEHANLIKKASFPPLSLFVSVVLSAAVNFALFLAIFVLFLIAVGEFPGVKLLGLLPAFLLTAALAGAIGLLVGTVNVFFRDVHQIVSIGLQVLFWTAPIVYPATIITPALKPWFSANPLFGLVVSAQQAVTSGLWPDPRLLAAPLLWVIVLAPFALFAYRRLYPDLLDEV